MPIGNLIFNLKIAIPNHRRQAFAESIGVTFESLRRWINGDSIPRGDHLISIAEKLNVEVDHLIYGNITVKKDDPELLKNRIMELELDINEYKERIEELKGYNSVLQEKISYLEESLKIKKQMVIGIKK